MRTEWPFTKTATGPGSRRRRCPDRPISTRPAAAVTIAPSASRCKTGPTCSPPWPAPLRLRKAKTSAGRRATARPAAGGVPAPVLPAPSVPSSSPQGAGGRPRRSTRQVSMQIRSPGCSRASARIGRALTKTGHASLPDCGRCSQARPGPEPRWQPSPAGRAWADARRSRAPNRSPAPCHRTEASGRRPRHVQATPLRKVSEKVPARGYLPDHVRAAFAGSSGLRDAAPGRAVQVTGSRRPWSPCG